MVLLPLLSIKSIIWKPQKGKMTSIYLQYTMCSISCVCSGSGVAFAQHSHWPFWDFYIYINGLQSWLYVLYYMFTTNRGHSEIPISWYTSCICILHLNYASWREYVLSPAAANRKLTHRIMIIIINYEFNFKLFSLRCKSVRNLYINWHVGLFCSVTVCIITTGDCRLFVFYQMSLHL